MRRQYYRKRLRKMKLLEVLIRYDMVPLTCEELAGWKRYSKERPRSFPQSKEFLDWLKKSPYDLRHRALDENITRQELGRIFYHFIQRRGFRSSRKGGDSNDKGKIFKGGEGITGISEVSKDIEGFRTFGSYLYSRIHGNREGREVFRQVWQGSGTVHAPGLVCGGI